MKAARMFYKLYGFFLKRAVITSSCMWQQCIFHMFSVYVYVMYSYFFFFKHLVMSFIHIKCPELRLRRFSKEMQMPQELIQWVVFFLWSQNQADASECGWEGNVQMGKNLPVCQQGN